MFNYTKMRAHEEGKLANAVKPALNGFAAALPCFDAASQHRSKKEAE